MQASFAGNPLFALHEPNELAARLNQPLRKLRHLANSSNNYVPLERYTGHKLRHVEAPRRDLRSVQCIIADALRRVDQPEYLHSGRRGRSHVTNAAIHRGHRWLCQIDLRSYYEQITATRIRSFFADTLDCTPDVARLLTRLCTTRGHAPAGSRVSQPIAYHVTAPLFDELSAHSDASDVLFTVFVDDLCFSGAGATSGFLWEVKKIIHHHGFSYHRARCHPPGRPKLVTGVYLAGEQMRLSPIEARRITEEVSELHQVETDEHRLRTLLGRVAAANSIDRRYRPLVDMVQARLRTLQRTGRASARCSDWALDVGSGRQQDRQGWNTPPANWF